MADKALLSVRGLHAGYGEVEILRGIDLVVGSGDIVAVLGANGAGKSTLNMTISGLVAARRGAIEFDGRSIQNADPDALGQRHVREVLDHLATQRVQRELGSGDVRHDQVEQPAAHDRCRTGAERVDRGRREAGQLDERVGGDG